MAARRLQNVIILLTASLISKLFPDEFPWQVSLKSLGSHICGGSIVNRNQVITAARCCDGQLAVFDRIVAGMHDRYLEGNHQSRAISKMEFHGSWNTPAFDHDICLVTVSTPFDFNDPNVQPVEFFKTADAEIPPETVCNSTGWGLTTGGGRCCWSHRSHQQFCIFFKKCLIEKY